MLQTGPGVQVDGLEQTAWEHRLRVLGETVPLSQLWEAFHGVVIGHGYLEPHHGMGSENAINYGVVPVDGDLSISSPLEQYKSDWTASGAGTGNTVVISIYLKAHEVGPVVGVRITWLKQDPNCMFRTSTAGSRGIARVGTNRTAQF